MGDFSLHQRIIEYSYEIFTTRGIKSVTMDAISTALSISKRTLYEEFESKNNLVHQIATYINECYQKRNDEIYEMDINVLEKIFLAASINSERVNKEGVFFMDLAEHYPLLLEEIINTSQDKYYNRLLKNIDQGCKEGVFCDNLNYEIVINIFFNTRMSTNYSNKKYNLMEVHIYGSIFFLRSIATAKGIEKIDELCKLNNINIYK